MLNTFKNFKMVLCNLNIDDNTTQRGYHLSSRHLMSKNITFRLVSFIYSLLSY